MGQYGNQPDFGTEATSVTPSDVISFATNLNQSCLYTGVAGDIKVILSNVIGIQGVTSSLSAIDAGTGYADATGAAVTSASGLGVGLLVNIVTAAGVVTSVAINSAGSGYRQGDVITVVGGNTDATFRINVIDALPTEADSVIFKNVSAGSILPVIVNYVLATGTAATAGDIIALK